MRRWASRLLVLVTMGVAAAVLTGCGGTPARASAPAVEVDIHFSHFVQDVVTVPAGTAVNVTLKNEDPIEHEWIVGTEEVHERHRNGTEAYHGSIPTEVTIPALSTRKTAVRFDVPGDYAFICHLPGHEAYGMRAILRVVAS